MMTKEEKQELKYANIGDRLFAGLLDLSMLYFLIIPVSGVIFALFSLDINPAADAMNQIMINNPQLRGNDQALFQILYEQHNEALMAGVKIFIYQSFIQLLLIGAYFVPMTAIKGKTLGKHLVGLRVIDNITHKDISKSQSFIRFVSYMASVTPLFLGMFWGSFRKDRRTWHDFLADTAVIYDENGWYKKLWKKIMRK